MNIRRGIKSEDSHESDLNIEITAWKKVGRIYGSMDFSSTRSTDSKCDLKALEEEALRTTKEQDSMAQTGVVHRQRDISDDLSENHSSGSTKRKFVKVNPRGEEDILQEKIFDNDINYIFAKDKTKFIGEFKADQYKIIRGYINGSKHLRLYYTKLENFHTRIASIAIIHGYGEHSGRFLEMAEHFVREGFVVHLIDLRGSGFSGGSHGVASVDELHEDIKLLLQQAGRDLPLFLYGHSLGASLIASLLIRNKWLNVSGVILTSAMFGFAQERKVDYLKKFFIRFFGGYFEEVVISGRISNTHLTKNNYQIKKIVDDRVSSPFVTLRMAKNAIELMDYIKANAEKFRYPSLIIHGYEDKITRCQDSVRFYNKIGSTDKKLKIFVDGFHELHHDIEKEKLKTLMTEWMKEKLEAKNVKKFGILENVKLGLKRKGLRLWQKFLLLLLTFLYFYFLRK